MVEMPKNTILVVDDIPENIDILAGILSPHYRVVFATDGEGALRMAQRLPPPGLILLDVIMPDISGYEVCRRLKADLKTRDIPVIFVTGKTEAEDEAQGLRLGAVDYLHKASHASIVLQRVRIHLELHHQSQALEARVRERTRQLEETRLEIVRRLGRAGEYRDNETGMHVIRMSYYASLLAQAAGLPEAQSELLLQAAPMHDIGKIGIPDRILLKPGKLDAAEWDLMKKHTLIGGEIIGDHDSDLLRMARSVALTHHERWEGTGYPLGLAGAAIPVEGRIVAIADVYDALTSVRPYKQAWLPADAMAYIRNEASRAFEPELTRVFVELMPQLLEIRARYPDIEHPPIEATEP